MRRWVFGFRESIGGREVTSFVNETRDADTRPLPRESKIYGFCVSRTEVARIVE